MKIYVKQGNNEPILINDEYYVEFTKSATLFEDSFRLGKTICESYSLKLDKEANLSISALNNPDLFLIKDDNNNLLKTLYVDEVEFDDTTSIYKLADGMIKFNFGYDAEPLISIKGYATLLEILQDICEKAGIETDIESFASDDLQVSWYDNTITARNYLQFIGEINNCFFVMTPDNKLAMKQFINVSQTEENDEVIYIQTPIIKANISYDFISDYKVGIQHTITRVVYDNGQNVWTYGEDTGETYYVDTANVFITSSDQVERIYNNLKGFTYYNFTSQNIPIDNLSAGDLINFINENEEEIITFAQYSGLNYMGDSWFGGISLEVKNSKQEETEIINTTEKIKRLKITIDRDNNIIKQEITETNNQVANNTSSINNNYQEIIQKLGNTVDDNELEAFKQSMITQLDATQLQISNIESIVTTDGVEYVRNTSGTFDKNGLTMTQDGANTKSILNQNGMDIQDVQGSSIGGESLLFAGYVDNNKATSNQELAPYVGQTIVYTRNMIVKNYLTIGTHSRIEDYENGTGVFHLD